MPWPGNAWWRDWGDARLEQLITQALADQPGLLLARARQQQAQALADGVASNLGPQWRPAIDTQLQRYGEHGLAPPPLAGSVRWNHNALMHLNWEWDIFGRQRAGLDAAIGRQRAAQAETQAARVALAAQVAALYVQLARISQQQALLEQLLAQREEQVVLHAQRHQAGLDSRDALAAAAAALAQGQGQRAAWADAAQRARHALANACGLGPQALADLQPAMPSSNAQAEWPSSADGAPALPLDLLGRRADLAALRWRAQAAGHAVEGARAAFYPNLDLVAFAGLSSIGLNHVLSLGSATAGIGPALRLPFFAQGSLRAELGARQAEADAAVQAFNAALLQALREVADELVSLHALAAQQAAQTQARRALADSLSLARQRHAAGLAGVQPVLTAQAALLDMARIDIDLQAQRALTQAALARALGGGWRDQPAPPASGRTALSRPPALPMP